MITDLITSENLFVNDKIEEDVDKKKEGTLYKPGVFA